MATPDDRPMSGTFTLIKGEYTKTLIYRPTPIVRSDECVVPDYKTMTWRIVKDFEEYPNKIKRSQIKGGNSEH